MTGETNALIRWLLDQDKEKLWDIKEHRERRSLNANAYFHVLCQKIAEVVGSSLLETKNWIMANYGQIDEEMGCIILRDDIDWRKTEFIHLLPTTATRTMDDGKLYRVYKVIRGSHTYDTKEMARLIDGAVDEAKQVGVETMTPAELQRLKEAWHGQHTPGRE